MATKISKLIVFSFMLLFSVSCSREKPTHHVRQGWYTVICDDAVRSFSRLDVYSGGTYIYNGNEVYVSGDVYMLQSKKYAKITVDGKKRYAPLGNLKYYGPKSSTNRSSNGVIALFEDNLAYYLIFVIIAIIVISIFINSIFWIDYLLMVALPWTIFCYFDMTYDGYWMCYPSFVGWPISIISFFLILAVAGLLCSNVMSSFSIVTQIFSAPLYAILFLFPMLLNASAVLRLISEFFIQDLVLAVVFLLMMIPSSWKYIGNFKDRNGVDWDVWVR